MLLFCSYCRPAVEQGCHDIVEAVELQHVGTVGEGIVGVGMNLEEIAVGSEGLGSESHGRHELPVTASLASSCSWSLHGVCAVHDDHGDNLFHVGDVSEVYNQIVVAETVATLGEPYLLGSALKSLLNGVAHRGFAE